MSAAILNQLQGLKEQIQEMKLRIDTWEAETESLKSEVYRLQVAKRPDRPPIRVPKMPKALQSIGVGLVKE